MSLSLAFDAMMFAVIVFVSIRTGISLPGGQPSIFRTIVEDSTVYFLVIFSSHLLSLIMLLVTRPSLQLLPALGNLVLLPLMISRLMLSLKRASRDKESGWTSDALSGAQVKTGTHMEFAPPPEGSEEGVGTGSGEVSLADLDNSQENEKTGEDNA